MEQELTDEDFTAFLMNIMNKPKLIMDVQAYFDSYSLDTEIVPHWLYLMGFGHYLEQHVVKPYNSPMMRHLQSMNSLQPMPSELISVLPELRHKPVIPWEHATHLPFKYRELRPPQIFPENHTDLFYSLLGSATLCNRQQRWYEAWAYALAAYDYVIPEYKCSTLCQLAISSAHLYISPEVTWYALQEAVLSQVIVSQQWEWMCACVQVLVAFGMFKEEQSVFEYSYSIIPVKSAWFETLLTHHLKGLMDRTENAFAQNLALKNMGKSFEFSHDSLETVVQFLKDIKKYSSKLITPGAEMYYKAMEFFYRSMLKKKILTAQQLLENGQNLIRLACQELLHNDPRYIEATQIAAFLNNDIADVRTVSSSFRIHTQTHNSILAAELWLKCTLIDLNNSGAFESMWIDSDEMAHHGYEEYLYSTFGKGYRLDTFYFLNRYYKKIAIHSNDMQLGYGMFGTSHKWQIVTQDDSKWEQNSSKSFVHNNRWTEQAYIIGYNIANKFKTE